MNRVRLSAGLIGFDGASRCRGAVQRCAPTRFAVRPDARKAGPAVLGVICAWAFVAPAAAQSDVRDVLCDAAQSGGVVALVYDKDRSKGCAPRIIDVHQVAIGHNGQLYMHGWQSRGCTKGRDYASKRIFRFDKIKSVTRIDGQFGEKSRAVKAEGWSGCIGNNCFIKEHICE